MCACASVSPHHTTQNNSTSFLLSQGDVPPTPFIVVSMVMTLAFLGAWRALYVQLTGSEVEVKGTQGKKSGVMDIFRMVTTLINRW